MNQGLGLFTKMNQAAHQLVQAVIQNDAKVRYVGVTGIYLERYTDNLILHFFTVDGNMKITETRTQVAFPAWAEVDRVDRSDVYAEYCTYRSQGYDFEGAFLTNGKASTLQELIKNGSGYAIGDTAWSLQSILSCVKEPIFSKVLKNLSMELGRHLSTYAHPFDCGVSFKVNVVPYMEKLVETERWQDSIPARIKNWQEFRGQDDMFGHIRLTLYCVETNQEIGDIDTGYLNAKDLDGNAIGTKEFKDELIAYGELVSRQFASQHGVTTFELANGKKARFVVSVANNTGTKTPLVQLYEQLSQPRTPQAVSRQKRFIEMTKILAEKGYKPKTSVNNVPIYVFPAHDNVELHVGATFAVMVKEGNPYLKVYDLQQDTLDGAYDTATQLGHPIVKWMVQSMDLRSAVNKL